MDEGELLGAARSGDRQAFDELVRRTFVETFTLARRLTGNEEDAHDVVQEAYLRAWKGIGKFRGDSAFSTWLYRITANTASSHVHRRRRQRAEPFEEGFEPVDARAEEQVSQGAESAETCTTSRTRTSPTSSASRCRLRRCVCTAPGASCATCSTTREPRPMRCEEATSLLPGLVDGETISLDVQRHVDSCLRCQAELARYRRLLRTLAALRTRYIEPTPGLLGETLAAITDAAEHGARRTLVSGRRLAFAGAIGGGALAAGATAAVLIARSRRRSAVGLAV